MGRTVLFYDPRLDQFYATSLLKLRVIAASVGNNQAIIVTLAGGTFGFFL